MKHPEPEPPHMTPEAFRAEAMRAVEFVARYMEQAAGIPVRPPTRPGDVLKQIPALATEEPGGDEEWDRVFRDLDAIVMPSIMNWQSPHFFGYFPCNSTGPAIIGDLIATGLAQQGMLWQTAPGANEIERALLDQMGRAMGLPESFLSNSENGGGCIQSTASDATLVALVAGRRRVTDRGADFARTTAYASTQTHSSFIKAGLIAGLAANTQDDSRVRSIMTNDRFQMDPAALERALRDDMAQGLTPAMVCATLGTTGVTAIDPLNDIARVIEETGAKDAGCWLHVDAAHAGALLVCPEHRAMIEGLERADSLCFNPHKWLLVNFDCDLFWTSDRHALTDSMSITPEYLRNDATDSGEVFDYRDWGVPLGRRFRAMKLWLVLRHYGLSGLRDHVRLGIEQAKRFETHMQGDDRFEILAPRTMNLVCVALKEGDAATRRLLNLINERGPAFLTPTNVPLPGGERLGIRVAIGSINTRSEHIDALADQLGRFADEAIRG